VARPGAGEAGPTDRREMRRADRAPALVPPPGPGRVVGGDSARAGARDVDAVWGCDRASSIGPLGTGQRRGFARVVKSSSWGAPVQGHRGPSGLKSTKVSRLRSLSGRPNPPVVDAAAAIRGAAIAAAGALGARHGGWVVWQFGPTKYANYRRFQIWPMAAPQTPEFGAGRTPALARGRHPSRGLGCFRAPPRKNPNRRNANHTSPATNQRAKTVFGPCARVSSFSPLRPAARGLRVFLRRTACGFPRAPARSPVPSPPPGPL